MAPKEFTLTPAYDRVVVTGGGSGIGRSVALAIAATGTGVYVLGRRVARLEETVRRGAGLPGRIVPVTCDIRAAETVAAAFRTIEEDGGPAQLLYHSAAAAYGSLAEDITPEGFAHVVQSSLVGAFHVIHRWAEPLIGAGLPGACVAVTSALASRETPGVAHSSASKAGVEGFVRSAAREWGRYGIRLNTIGPGPFPSEGTDELWEQGGIRARMESATALGRLGTEAEIAGPSLFLLSDAARYVTGVSLPVDGGLRLAQWTVHSPAESVSP
ncbi:NAD(P)-dependent dehydrogenase (short-subunit alcohol dehydrogenase family) [Amycolatopsis bartoniae]|uniref:2,4-dienoyl-CoA reductase n=1 Tax=Amycolatopsis bartoniae TaxID=941986 RepID=A0A8H9INF7_9PSEU|nr:SDR family oxidoreductase [Amycolatopsis bartoniae]MBB2939912.1 NAD(P)-dependent dehydrogenase (short-subunit alcohol dehydrogenase family) [Amycolatopsis bartoniae]TVT08304.1 SDR family oxidoreductase [Amycolatopsis bartoniae]GHF35721.1 2,4-dienoyl-CoA reductase [Amycolatopsis bartoniae]